ncbi:MAG: rare lipoprotein [Acetobacteraceae bacterium]|jgi:rare lipoprotein A|nr:rare lipoprotein [Acetobacteraceae bacterium]
MVRWHAAIAAGLLCVAAGGAVAGPVPPDVNSQDAPGARQEAERLDKLPPVVPATSRIDNSGRKQRGRASFYAKRFTHRKMADGHPMSPNENVAASKTLPLGSVATVTNLENGKTATVKIEDRGPYVKGRVVDLAPKVADEIDLKQKGVTPVEVKPITLPQRDGGVKLGAGAAAASPQEVQQDAEITQQLAAPKGNISSANASSGK